MLFIIYTDVNELSRNILIIYSFQNETHIKNVHSPHNGLKTKPSIIYV